MKKVLFTLLAVFGMTFATAQDTPTFINFDNDSQFDVTVGRSGFAIADAYGNADGIGGWMISTSYDFIEGDFKVAPEVDVVFWDQGFGTGVVTGIEVGLDYVYALAQYDTQDDIFGIGLGGEIGLGSDLALDISYTYASDIGWGLSSGLLQLGLTLNL